MKDKKNQINDKLASIDTL